MKKILFLFIAVLTLGVTARAADDLIFKDGDWLFLVNPDAKDEVYVIQYEGAEGSDAVQLSIPSYTSYKGNLYTVTALYECLFSEVTFVDDDMNTLWSHDTFRKLKKVNIPNSVTTIGNYAFSGTSLTSINIPNSVTYIGERAFSGTSLTSINIPNSVTYIGESAFSGCTSLTSYNIPNPVRIIGSGLFSGCTSLTSINIPNWMTTIGGGMFRGCTSLTSVNIPNWVTEIGDSAFSGCTSLSSIDIPNAVTVIGHYAFSGCTSLPSIDIPNAVKVIGSGAFSGCSSLTTLTIPKSVESFYINPFYDCPNMKEVVFEGNTKYTLVDGMLYELDHMSGLPYRLIGCSCAITGPIKILDTVKEIAYYAFSGCTSLTSINIPNSVTRIQYYAFRGCTSLTSINIPNSVTEILYNAFSGCTSLTSINIPNSVTEIGSGMFSGCTSLTSINISNSVTEIGSGMFSGCTSLTSIVIPSSVDYISYSAFEDCSSLKKIFALPLTPPSLGRDVWANVDKNTEVYIPSGSLNSYSARWSYFSDFREMGALDIIMSDSTISIEKGKTATIIPTLIYDDYVTIESKTWSSSNPEVATVEDGVVTAVAAGTATISYTVVDGYGCPHIEYCEVTVTDLSGIEDIEADDCNAPAEYYNLNGVRVNADNLTPGLYIKRQSGKATKVLVK